jgi:protein TonB
MGSVENVTVVESTNRAFERPSIRAVEKYKYKPRVIDGIAVEVQDVMEKISFEMEKS